MARGEHLPFLVRHDPEVVVSIQQLFVFRGDQLHHATTQKHHFLLKAQALTAATNATTTAPLATLLARLDDDPSPSPGVQSSPLRHARKGSPIASAISLVRFSRAPACSRAASRGSDLNPR